MSIFTMGIDVGSTASKCIILKDGKEIVAKAVISVGTGTSGPARAMKEALEQVGLSSVSELQGAVATGYGRNSLAEVPAQMSELSCHAKGAYFLFPNVHSIIDIGGQDSKALKIGDNGMLENFVMNDKCAAGTGKFLEVTSNKLGSDIENIDELAHGATPENISSMCTVFAESEIISLLAQDIPKENIAAGILKSIANKGISILNKGRLEDTIAFTGGLAQSKELVKMLENNLNKEIFIAEDAQIIGALGAAIIGFK